MVSAGTRSQSHARPSLRDNSVLACDAAQSVDDSVGNSARSHGAPVPQAALGARAWSHKSSCLRRRPPPSPAHGLSDGRLISMQTALMSWRGRRGCGQQPSSRLARHRPAKTPPPPPVPAQRDLAHPGAVPWKRHSPPQDHGRCEQRSINIRQIPVISGGRIRL